MPDPATPLVAPIVDRTPTSSFDAIVKLGLDKASDYAYPIVHAKLVKLGLDDATAAAKASNLCGSVSDVLFDVVDVVTDLKIAAKAK